MASGLKVEVVVGLVDRLSAPLRALAQQTQRVGRDLSLAGAGAVAGGLGILAPLRQAVTISGDLSAALTEVGIVADASAARMAAIRPELRQIAADANQLVPDLAAGLKDLTAKGLALDAAMAALPAVAKTSTAAGAALADMAGTASALITNLGIVPGQLQRTLDILTVAGNAGAFELRDMAREFPTLTAAMKGLEMQGETAAASLGAALQVAMKGAGSAPEAANNLLNLLSKLTAPGTVQAMQKQWGVDLPAAFRRWQAVGLNPVEESLRLIQERTGGDAFKIGEIFGDMQVMSALRPLLENIDEYRRIRDDAMAGTGASAAQFQRRMAEDPTQQWKALTIQAGNLADRVGQVLLPALLRLVEIVRPLIDRFAAWADANPALVRALVIGAAAIGGLSLAVGGLMLVFGPLLWVMGALVSPLGLAAVGLVAAAAAIWKYWGPLKGFFGGLWAGLQEGLAPLAPAFEAAFEVVAPLLAPVQAALQWVWDKLAALIGPVDDTGAAAEAMGRRWGTAIADMIQRTTLFVSDLMDLPGKMLAIGGDIIAGLWDGLKGKWAALASWWQEQTAWLGGLLRRETETHSPSRVFAAIGGDLIAGLQQGLAARIPAVFGQLRGLAAGLAATSLSVAPMTAPAAAVSGAGGNRPGITINLTINAPPGTDAAGLATLATRELTAAAPRLAALYDRSDLR